MIFARHSEHRRVDMRKLIIAIATVCITFAIASVASAQVNQTFDQFSGFNCEDMKARLDRFAIELQNDQNSQGYIIVYGGSRGWRGEGQAWMKVAKDYLFNTRGVTTGRA